MCNSLLRKEPVAPKILFKCVTLCVHSAKFSTNSGDMKWLTVVFLSLCGQQALAAKILALCAVLSHSHSLWCYKYLSLLAERGHQITVLGVDKPKIKIANLTTFIVDGGYEFLKEMEFPTQMTTLTAMHPGFTLWNEGGTKSVMHSQALQDLLSQYKNTEKPFDLIIHDNGNCDALLGLVPLFGNPPLLLATTYGSPQWMNFRAGNILNPAYVPSMITSGSDHRMTLYERGMNLFYYIFVEYVCVWIMEPFQDTIMREVLGENLPHVSHIAKQANIVIVNHHFALNNPRPMLPGVIGIAGLHISEPQPLPQEIKAFMDEAKDGAILLSFGTNVDSSWFSEDFESEILKGLSQLQQRVLWKWDKTIPNLPSNVKISNWLPQADMLVHPNMRLFVSHCGLLSTQEAIYRKVPLLALPVFLDQTDNAVTLVRLNLTIKLNVFKLTADELRDGIKEILSNPMYKRNIERMGELMADGPLTAQQLAVYWTEYTIRHQGAAHLRAASADMPWHQLLLLDVLAVTVSSALVALWLVKASMSFIICSLFRRVKNKKD